MLMGSKVNPLAAGRMPGGTYSSKKPQVNIASGMDIKLEARTGMTASMDPTKKWITPTITKIISKLLQR